MSVSLDRYTFPMEKDSQVRIRVLSSAINGFEWFEEGKPKRAKKAEDAPSDLGINQWGKEIKPKYFWAFPVWNHNTQGVQICCITQVGIQDQIRELVNNPDWGSPFSYDITIKRTDGDKTTYSVVPHPPKALPEEAQAEVKATKIDFEKWMNSENPFSIDEFSAEALEEVFNNS